MVCIWLNGLAPWCIRFYAPCSSGQWHRQHRAKRPDRILGDCPQSFQEATEDAFLFVVIAVADPHAPSVAPDLGCEKQESQAGCRQRGVLESFHLGVFLAIAVLHTYEALALFTFPGNLKKTTQLLRKTGV